MITCPACGTANPDDSKFCNSCGSPLGAMSAFETPQPGPQIYQPPEQAISPDQPAQQYAYAPAPSYQAPVTRPTKDRSIALVLEILPGLFGFLGFGWMYSGNTAAGIAWLVGFLIWTIIATIISVFTGGLGILCWGPISIACIAISAINLNRYASSHPERFG